MSIENIFRKNQKILKDYKENKLFYIGSSSIITATPLIIAYGLFYEKYIRKIPFHVQLGLIIVMYKGSFRLMQEMVYIYEKVYSDLEKKLYQ